MNETQRESSANLHFGLIEEIDDARAMVKVRLPALDDMITHWLFVLFKDTQDNKHYSLPEKGTQVSILLDPRGETGVVLGAIYSEVDKPPVTNRKKWHKLFSDGTSLEYDRESHELKADVQGKVTIDATGPVVIKSAQSVEVEGLTIKVKGQLVEIEANVIDLNAPITKTKNLLVGGKLEFVPLP